MDRVLEDFISTLRGSGVRISLSESLDAAHAVQLVGYDERRLLKDSLAAALAKSAPEKEIFSDCFDRFFSFDFFPEYPEDTPRREAAEGMSSLSRMLLEGDQAGLITTMREAARTENLNAIQFYTQKSLYVMRILDRMGLNGLDRDIRELFLSGSPSSSATAARLEEARDYVYDNVRAYVEDQYRLFSGSEADKMLETYLRNTKTLQPGAALLPANAAHHPAAGQEAE